MDNTQLEAEIKERASRAPRITPEVIEGLIVSEHYFTAKDGRAGAIAAGTYAGREPADLTPFLRSLGLLTFCVLVLRNGFTVTGESACASPENFDAEIGCKVARANAIAKVSPLEGYLLKQMLHDARIKAQPV